MALDMELDSFYTEISTIETDQSESTAEATPDAACSVDTVATPPPPPPVSSPLLAPLVVAAPASPPATPQPVVAPHVVEANWAAREPESHQQHSAKKKKKTKLAPGLSLKKKGVSSLVAKWQQVQKEVRRDYKDSG